MTQTSRIMADKVTTMSRSKLGGLVGAVSETEMPAPSRALVVVLGIA